MGQKRAIALKKTIQAKRANRLEKTIAVERVVCGENEGGHAMKLFGVLCFLALCAGLFLVFPPLGLGLLVMGVVVKILMR